MTDQLRGWHIRHAPEEPWIPWGASGDARAKLLGEGDGYVVALVEASAGYVGGAHEHPHTEFLYVVDGHLRCQGRRLSSGSACIASAGSVHDDFEALSDATFLSIFKL